MFLVSTVVSPQAYYNAKAAQWQATRCCGSGCRNGEEFESTSRLRNEKRPHTSATLCVMSIGYKKDFNELIYITAYVGYNYYVKAPKNAHDYICFLLLMKLIELLYGGFL